MTRLIQPKSPNLPLSPPVPDRQYLDQLCNVQRLYYNRLDNTFNALLDYRGGSNLNYPFASCRRTTNLLLTANTATQVTLDTNDYINGCENDGTDGIHALYAGFYNYQFSIQFANTDTQIHTAYVWLRVNGVDLVGTGSKFDVPGKHGSSDGYLIAACNFYVELGANDYVQLYAAVDQAYSVSPAISGIYFEAYAAQTSPFKMPSIPSVVATLSFVSSLPA